ncbi:hypothetical protein EC973_008429 [Apophysomyces ossiformis]|uniref:Uncharacterized protein n=1 Tax=Apophysomyces ossiformis TaxID=679940 RepID=A0A8H7BNG5_9FUNG|nr:hypothetical protein EC973_008429 [Apophysomyces ossiformis]
MGDDVDDDLHVLAMMDGIGDSVGEPEEMEEADETEDAEDDRLFRDDRGKSFNSA